MLASAGSAVTAAAFTLSLVCPAAVLAQPAIANPDLGVWTDAGSSGVVCIHTALLPNSKLLCFERPHVPPYPINANTNGLNSAEIDMLNGVSVDSFDTWTSKFTPIGINSNPFCAGHASMANGSILVIGGDNTSMVGADGAEYIYNGRKGRRIFNPCTGTGCTGSWVNLPEMTSERWYPTIVTLADGSNIIIGGTTKNLDFALLRQETDNNPTYEYWPQKAGNWPRVLPILNWAWPYMLYPAATIMPSNRVFLFVSNKTTILDPATDTEITTVPDMPVMDHMPWIYPHMPAWTVMPMTIKNNFTFKVQFCGGSKKSSMDASPMCWQINPDDANPTWVQVPDMPFGSVMLDCIILPDGKILYVNGAGGGIAGGEQGEVYNAWNPVRTAMMFDPEAPVNGTTWTSLAAATQYRLYHSGVVLTESGHVVTMGSEMDNYDDMRVRNLTNCPPFVRRFGPDCKDPFNYRLERFEPPYLQKARRQGRPAIATAPATITHKSTFTVTLSTPADKVDRVTFIRYTTTTHQINTDQRFIELRILGREDKTLYLEAPDVPGRAPPGNWMLFALDKDGVPSVAKTVQLQLGAATTVTIPPSASRNSGSTGTAAKNAADQPASFGFVSALVAFALSLFL